mmetsp:Transcript_873/g.960  ORF Transcript_873/g.960 Transcript_873/m.960 type:complete len:113 (-) Transcript_873:63-401(-)
MVPVVPFHNEDTVLLRHRYEPGIVRNLSSVMAAYLPPPCHPVPSFFIVTVTVTIDITMIDPTPPPPLLPPPPPLPVSSPDPPVDAHDDDDSDYSIPMNIRNICYVSIWHIGI